MAAPLGGASNPGRCYATLTQRSSYEEWIESYLPQFDVLPVIEETTVVYAAIRMSLRRSGLHSLPMTFGSPPWPCSIGCLC